VRLGFEADTRMPIHRREVWDRICNGNGGLVADSARPAPEAVAPGRGRQPSGSSSPPVTRPGSRTVTARTAEVSRPERGHGRGRGTGRCRRPAAPAILHVPFSETNDRTRPPRPPRRHRASGR
jgi:hypothetical protein